MKKIIIAFIIPLLSMGQITEADETELATQIGTHIIIFNGSIKGGVSLNKLPLENGEEYHSLIWTNNEYDINGSRTVLKFKSSSADIESLFDMMRKVIKSNQGKNIKLQDQLVTLKPSSFKDEIYFIAEVDGTNRFFYIKAKGLYELFGKTWNKKDWKNFR